MLAASDVLAAHRARRAVHSHDTPGEPVRQSWARLRRRILNPTHHNRTTQRRRRTALSSPPRVPALPRPGPLNPHGHRVPRGSDDHRSFRARPCPPGRSCPAALSAPITGPQGPARGPHASPARPSARALAPVATRHRSSRTDPHRTGAAISPPPGGTTRDGGTTPPPSERSGRSSPAPSDPCTTHPARPLRQRARLGTVRRWWRRF